MKQKMSTADVAGEVACLRQRITGMRLANIYDINQKVLHPSNAVALRQIAAAAVRRRCSAACPLRLHTSSHEGSTSKRAYSALRNHAI